MGRGKYQKVSVTEEGFSGDETVDDLFPSHSGGRGLRRHEYLRLDNLDAQGTLRRRAEKAHKRLSRAPSMLVCSLLGIIFIIAAISIGTSIHGHTSPQRPVLNNGTTDFRPATIVISLDGMNPHYVSPERTPNLHHLVEYGAAVPYVEPVFPSETFPNHWTIVTGLYPLSHGIVGNTFYDPEMDEYFVNVDPAHSLNPEFWGGEPIWVGAKRQGLKVAAHMWPGSSVLLKTGVPDYVDGYNGSTTLKEKVDRVFELLDLPSGDRPDLILTYVPLIDMVGHKYGITGLELLEALKLVDEMVGNITEGLAARHLANIVNFVVLSDHGMAPTSDSRVFYLDDVIDMGLVKSRLNAPLSALRFYEKDHENDPTKDPRKDEKETYEKLKKGKSGNVGYEVYFSDEMPKEWHFDPRMPYGRRLAPLFVVPDVGFTVTTHEEYNSWGNKLSVKGLHGYNNSEPLMHAFFAAQGPYFKPGHYMPLKMVDIYQGLCESIGMLPRKTHGSFKLEPLTRPMYEVYPNVYYNIEHLNGSTFEVFEPIGSRE